MKFCSGCGAQVEEGVKFCPGCGNSLSGAANMTVVTTVQEQAAKWWENKYSPIPHEQVAATLRATLTPSEVVVAISKIHWWPYARQVIGLVFGIGIAISLGFGFGSWFGDDGIGVITAAVMILWTGIIFLIKLSKLRRSMIVITDQRFLGSFGVKVFSTDKLDIPLRSVDSFGVDDSLLGNIFGYTRVKMMSRSSTYFFPWITRDSCQTVKNAYYDWDARQSK